MKLSKPASLTIDADYDGFYDPRTPRTFRPIITTRRATIVIEWYDDETLEDVAAYIAVMEK